MQRRNYSRRYKQHLYPDFRKHCEQTQQPCWLCGQPIDYTPHSQDRFELDHYHPASKRPDLLEDPANFRPSHATCNRTRSNNTITTTITGTQSRNWD